MRLKALLFVAVVMLLWACSITPKISPKMIAGVCDEVIYGACVFFDKDAQRITRERLEAGFRASATLWGTEPTALHGTTVLIRGRDVFQLGNESVWGVSYMAFPRMDYTVPMPQCPELVLAHEWGHAGARVEGHDDPRFDDALIMPFLHEYGLPGC